MSGFFVADCSVGGQRVAAMWLDGLNMDQAAKKNGRFLVKGSGYDEVISLSVEKASRAALRVSLRSSIGKG